MCLRLRLCWRWPLIPVAAKSLPAPELSRQLAQWLQGPRSRALRRAGIGRRERVLEVGCGHGFVTEELARRAGGTVVALDLKPQVLPRRPAPNVLPVAADGRALPFRDASFDLAFLQTTLLWISPPEAAVQEAARVLAPGGALVALEPDYGAMIEEPDLGLRVVWLDALERAGAEPLVGRMLPRMAEEAGLEPWVEFAHIPRPAEPAALDLLAELPLTVLERERVEGAREILSGAGEDWSVFLHVPWLLVVAERQ